MGKKKVKKRNHTGLMILGGLAILVILGIVFFAGGDSTPKASQASIDAFAQCLTEKGTTMYGTFWCPHCAQTKKRFGSSFQYITYIECDPRGDNEQSELCIEKEIESYDTWEFSDGSRVIGEPSFEELAEQSGCEVPK